MKMGRGFENGFWPDAAEIPELLGLRDGSGINDLVRKTLLEPVEDFFSRPGKRFRARLVRMACQLSDRVVEGRETSPECDLACRIIEAIHAGALIVDDIQDGSRYRREAPTMHRRYGVPLALNVGNWLYFWPLKKIQDLRLGTERELAVYRECVDILVRAHFGQAVDVGVRIDEVEQQTVPGISMAAMELKSGVLIALAMRLGAHVGGASAARVRELDDFGHRFGVGLQMFDDIGALAIPANAPPGEREKRFEDLYLRRPSWVWAYAASNLSARDYATFIDSVRRLPDETYLNPWLELHDFVATAKVQARNYLENLRRDFEQKFEPTHPAQVGQLNNMISELEKAYG